MADGSLLIAPALLTQVLNGLEVDILQGSAVLPMTCEEFDVYLASKVPQLAAPASPSLGVGAPGPRRWLLPTRRPSP